jgi:type III pantothenate kinase
LVGAYAAKTLYPESRIIIDFGTAITFDFLSKRGDYQGGFILPGIGSTLRVLSSCALLPDKIILRKSKTLIPKDTRESINRGIAEGFSVMLNALVKKYKRILKLSAKDKVVITGGDAKFILPKIEFSYQYEPFLVIKGMVILAKKFSPQ